jgi:hypothetical protein
VRSVNVTRFDRLLVVLRRLLGEALDTAPERVEQPTNRHTDTCAIMTTAPNSLTCLCAGD